MIIAISGKKQNGKDTVGKIIQYLTSKPPHNLWSKEAFIKDIVPKKDLYTNWKIKKFADHIKDTLCLWLDCTKEQLENEEYKNTILGEEWDKYGIDGDHDFTMEDYGYFSTIKEAQRECQMNGESYNCIKKIQMTPRLLMQLLGTECGRNIIHPNIWTNILFRDYKSNKEKDYPDNLSLNYYHTSCKHCKKGYDGYKRQTLCKECILDDSIQFFPNWIITDLRFPNELEECKKRDAILIRVNRSNFANGDITRKQVEIAANRVFKVEHISETILDDYNDWDYVVDNNGTIGELIKQVKNVLIKEKII